MTHKNDDQGASPLRAAPRPTDSSQNQQTNNSSRINNPYASWSFEQLYSECKRRGLL